MAMTRASLAVPSLMRRHGDRRAAHHRSCYGGRDAGAASLVGGARAMTPQVQAIRDALAQRTPVPDAAFDRVFPDELRERSALHWTPVEVAIRAAALLAPAGNARVLDVGAGAGKLCLVGALATGSAVTWWGIEHDPHLVAAANRAAWQLELGARTRFVPGDGSQLAWDEFDAIYFYNPFGMVMMAPDASPFVRYAVVQATLRRIEHQLARLRPGTRVVTYYGFGGTLPTGFARAAREPVGGDALELWIREA
jgi:predicted RNA methylase